MDIFGQEQVPLTDEIKEILEEYPDGQIFKSKYSKLIRILRELVSTRILSNFFMYSHFSPFPSVPSTIVEL